MKRREFLKSASIAGITIIPNISMATPGGTFVPPCYQQVPLGMKSGRFLNVYIAGELRIKTDGNQWTIIK